MTRQNRRKKANKRVFKYPNLRRAAENMGYNFTYLWRVLEGAPGFPGRPGLVDEFWAESAKIQSDRDARKSSVAR